MTIFPFYMEDEKHTPPETLFFQAAYYAHAPLVVSPSEGIVTFYCASCRTRCRVNFNGSHINHGQQSQQTSASALGHA